MAIQIEELIAELEKGSGYKHIDNKKLGYHHYEAVRFVFDKDKVTIFSRHGYDGEEDMSSEWFNTEWRCVLPRQMIDKALSQLVSEGHTMLAPADITETYSGRRAYGVSVSNTRSYTTNLELTLREGQKPIIELKNPEGMLDADSL